MEIHLTNGHGGNIQNILQAIAYPLTNNEHLIILITAKTAIIKLRLVIPLQHSDKGQTIKMLFAKLYHLEIKQLIYYLGNSNLNRLFKG